MLGSRDTAIAYVILWAISNDIARSVKTFWISYWKTLKKSHHDVIKGKHFPRYWPFVRGIQRSPVNSPHKGQWHGAWMSSLICAWTNGLVNNRDAGHLRRHGAHYDVTVMMSNVTVSGLATTNARTFAGTLAPMFGYRLGIGPASEGLQYQNQTKQTRQNKSVTTYNLYRNKT